MKCPNCKETSLVMSEKKGVEIDYCPDCRGIWLDRGELDKILEKQKSETEFRPEQSRYQSNSYERPYKKKKSLLEELFD